MTIVLPKVRLPKRRKDTLRRVRLIDALHQNLHRKLSFVSAPAGFGKTTLLVDFASDVDAVVCWYHIAPEDIDLIPFVRHIVAAFQQNTPGFGEALTGILGSSGVSPDPPSLATELINEIETKMDDFCVLILDDFHLVGEKQPIADFMETLLTHLPDQVRLVIGSRSVFGIPTANLYVREELATISTDQLRFRPDELQDLVKQNYRFNLTDEQATELASRSDGWIVAMLLAIHSLQYGAVPQFEGAAESVYTFLAEDVVNHLPEHLRGFLLATSILEEFTEPLLVHLLDTSQVRDLLEELEARNLFVNKVETAEGATYRYHQLFGEFLRHQLARSDPSRMRALHRRAAEWFHPRGVWEPAVNHAVAAGERVTAAQWMDQAAMHMFATGRQGVLSQWYETLAELPDTRQHAPRLLLNRAKMLTNQSAFEQAEQLLDIAEPALRALGDDEQAANAMVTRGMIRRFQGDYAAAIELADAAQQLLGKAKNAEENHQWYQAERLKGIGLSNSGKTEEAIAHLTATSSYFQTILESVSDDEFVRISHDLAVTLTDLGIVYLQSGHIFEAQRCFLDVLDIRQKTRGNLGDLATASNNVGYLYYILGRYREAWLAYEKALDAAHAAQWDRITIYTLNGRGDLLRDLEEYDQAELAYKQAREIGESSQEESTLGDTFLGLSGLECLRGNYNEALYFLREAARIQGRALESPEYQVPMGAIYLEMGHYSLASQAFERALDAWEGRAHPLQGQVLAAFLLGRALHQEGEMDAALVRLKQALTWSAQLGYDQFLIVAGREALGFLQAAATHWPNPQLLRLIERIEQFKTGVPQAEERSPALEVPEMHLEMRGFGTGQVRCDGELIPNAAWRSSGARALFFYIVDRGGVRKEDVALEFWPDFSAAKVNSNFHATLWRVRKALGGAEAIVFQNGRYSLNPAFTAWYDVAEFETYLQGANAQGVAAQQRAEAWRQAIDLYRQDYLEDVFMEWVDRRRGELRDAYLQALTGLAGWEMERSRFQQAKELYEKALAVDPYQDQLHLALMKCLVRAGSPTAAKAHYQAHKEFIKRELQADPSPELRAYYDQLT